MLIGMGCGAGVKPEAPMPVALAPDSDSIIVTTSVETPPHLTNVQRFGQVRYIPTVVSQPAVLKPQPQMDWQGWWKVGQDAFGRDVFVLIEGSDNYFYATNEQRSVEATGNWEYRADGPLSITLWENSALLFGTWINDETSYVLRGGVWEKWEKVADPMLPESPTKTRVVETQLTTRWATSTGDSHSEFELYEDDTYSYFKNEDRGEGGDWKFTNNQLTLTTKDGKTIQFTDVWLFGNQLQMKLDQQPVIWEALK